MQLSEEDIRAAYRLLLGREGDPKGLAGYVEAAKAGHITREQLVEAFLTSGEYLARNPQPQSQSAPTISVDPAKLVDELMPHILARLNQEQPWCSSVFVPSPETYAQPEDAPFMPYSTCSGSDFLHPRFSEILSEMAIRNTLHRKLWELVFVIHHLVDSGMVGPGRRGLCFGVGQELTPSVFAARGAYITATDAPLDIGVNAGWQKTNQHAAGLAQLPAGKMERTEFEQLVEWRECDMNAIDPTLTDYDFCWSACCFEHLGTLRHGMDFVINSVEKTLKPGGIAVHTTEFNLSSNDKTIESGGTVLYRRRDIEQLVSELRERGHEVQPFRVAPDMLTIDGYVDCPPYFNIEGPHLKLAIASHACTSVGLVIRRGS